MPKHEPHEHRSCSCGCDDGLDRREFLTVAGAGTGVAAFSSLTSLTQDVAAEDGDAPTGKPKTPAKIKAVFLYPPSTTFTDDPEGWWSWPGNDYDAEGRQRMYVEAIRGMEEKLGVVVDVHEQSIGSVAEADRIAAELGDGQYDGILIVMFYNKSLGEADKLLAAAAELNMPAIFYIGLGVKHGSITRYRREGVYLIQSLDNLDAIEYGLRMIGAKKRMSQTLLLSITEAPEIREGVEKFFGMTVRVLPFELYAERFAAIPIDAEARALIEQFKSGASELRDVSQESLENAAKAHLAIKSLLTEHGADGLTMNCLRRGMLKPCMSFATLNGELIPAACENDFAAMYGQLLGQLLTGAAGFQHNPAFETERNHYYGSHCTCSPKLNGPDGKKLPHLLRRFAHTNEGSCAIQVFWTPGDPVTMLHYYAGEEPELDVYTGRVVASHQMPPAGGCTTNVEVKITDRTDACMVEGHHNVLFVGDHARRFRLFANLFGMKLKGSGYEGHAF
jgi:L-fucose isomerase-like protein